MLNKTRIQSHGILGMKKRFLLFRLRAEKKFPIYANHMILPPCFDHLAINANASQKLIHRPLIHLESIGGE